MAQVDTVKLDPAEPLVHTYGEPEYSRRLTDKILAAFNHAYACGEEEIAAKLHALLALMEAREIDDHSERRGAGVLAHADLWKAFVEARNRYRACCDDACCDGTERGQSLAAMKSAYKRWSRI